MDSDSSDINMELDQQQPPRARRQQRIRGNKLTAEEKQRVSALLSPQNPTIHKRVGNIDLYRDSLVRLHAQRMLNDEVMNAYFDVITNPRHGTIQDPDAAVAAFDMGGNATGLPPLNGLAFNSFFYNTLVAGGHAKVANWTKGISLFGGGYDYLLVPIHIECDEHWCLLAINLVWRRIDYFDSLYSAEHRIDLDLIRDYLCREYNSRRPCNADQVEEMKPHHWKINEMRLTGPQQNNLFDCGVFVCQIAKALLGRKPVRGIKASDMSYWRGKMLLELMDY